ncbi:MAG: hypothetical protein KGZ81_09710 [Flavobacteriales bacterium]|nr:hypothetical protein [Flavobacteriales bacterium]
MDTTKVIAPGFNLPPILFKDKVVIINNSGNSSLELSGQSTGSLVVTRQFPLTFHVQGFESFTFPIDPFISFSFRNIITRRAIAKGKKRGTIKERFTTDDVEITISGVFISNEDIYPVEVDKLREFCELPISIRVECTLINNRGIDSIAIDTYDLPATAGVNNQAFQIKAYSDDVYNLLIEK